MIVKINGSVFDTERVMRFAPHKKDGLDFRPDDVCTLSMMAEQADCLEKCGFKTWTVDKMGWRFMLWKDGFGNTFPWCFAPISGNLEMPERSEGNGES